VRARFRHLAWRLAEPPSFLPPLAVWSLKAAAGCGLAWALGQALGSPRPFNAVLAVIILMQGNAYGSLLNALQFLLGVAAGLVLGIVANLVFGLSAPVLALVIFVTMLMGGFIKVSSQGFNNQIAISALLVLASGSADNVNRLWETALGGAVGVAVAALVWPPNPVRGLREEYRQVRRQIAADVRATLRLAGAGEDAEAHRRNVRAHAERADAAVAQVGPAEEALRWSPWHHGRIHDLSRLEDRLRLLSHLYRTTRALARQAAEAPRAERDEWERARPDLARAGEAAVEAMERRLGGQDAREAVRRGHEAVGRFAAAAPREQHAVALAAALDDQLSDVEAWRPPNEVDPEGLLMARVMRRLGRRLREPEPEMAAEVEFEERRRRTQRLDVAGALRRRPRTAPTLANVIRAAGIAGEADRGVRQVPVARIMGTEVPAPEFDASFQPRSGRLRRRWVDWLQLAESGGTLPPIEVYQVGDAYFVRDGHNRVSVARHLGLETIAARVVEVTTRAPVGPDADPRQLLAAAEYARFLERTQLDVSRPDARLEVSQLGRTDVILDHIRGHGYFLGVERGREVPAPEAAASWYDSVYRPVMEVVRAHDLQRRLPGWTEADLYLAITRLWLDLDEEGLPSGPETAAETLLADPGAADRLPGRRRPWRSPGVAGALRRLARRAG
jgi:uncharacterized membrane protein YgaE (UPF0421/DUF939 family)